MAEHGFSEGLIDQVRHATDLVELISSYTTVQQAGHTWKALCPFHAEKTASLMISREKQLFHCFGCGAGGDSFQFLMRMTSLTFPQAVRALARQAGITLPHTRGARPSQDHEGLYDVLDRAADFYHRQLLTAQEAARARQYLHARGVSEESVAAFRLGYAPAAWDGLLRVMVAQGWSPERLAEAGLVVARREGTGYYDLLRDRIVFPVHDLQGNVVGFGGRVLEEATQPKYLNTPETRVYHKGRLLYALDRARAQVGRVGRLILVEGYFDVIAAHQAGVTNVAATLGTSLTQEHLAVVQRFVRRVALLFDPDPAGLRAILRVLEAFVESELVAEVLPLEGREDPASFIQTHGADAFRALVNRPVRLLDFAIETMAPTPASSAGSAQRLDEKLAAAATFLPLLIKLRNAIERDHYFKRLSEVLGVEEGTLRMEARRLQAPVASKWSARQGGEPTPVITSAEELVLHLLLHGMVKLEVVREQLSPEDFADPVHRRIIEALFRLQDEMGAELPPAALGRLCTHLDDHGEAQRVVEVLVVREPVCEEPAKALGDCVRRLRRRRAEQEARVLHEQVAVAERAGNHDRLLSLERELVARRRQRQ